jgi:phosphoglycerate dehydrogenase-like enzyme
MVPPAMKLLESIGTVVWAPEKNQKKLGIQVRGATVIITEFNRITESVIESARGTLRGIVVYGVGYNHIDVNAATKRGIYVANCKGSNAESVAEFTFSLMLDLSKRTHVADRFIRHGRWRDLHKMPVVLKGSELSKKTLGLVGMGEIGRRVARIARGFNMRILVFDPYLSSESIVQNGAEPADLRTLLKEADYVSLHIPLSDETEGFLGDAEIELMKPTAHLINTARGALVNEKALLRALRKKRIAGAGLDVFSKEPLPQHSPFLELDNVIMAPHIGALTQEALSAMSLMSAEESVRIARGEAPINLINREVKGKSVTSRSRKG